MFVECPFIQKGYPHPHWPRRNREQPVAHWLEHLHPFTAVKDFYRSTAFVPGIVSTLQDLVGERVNEVLPALRIVFCRGAVCFRTTAYQ